MERSSIVSNILTAPVDKFVHIRPQILTGPLLAEVKTLENSIEHLGLFLPIIVRNYRDKFFIIDGRKRIAAIKRLKFMGRLPHNLDNIPYRSLDTGQSMIEAVPNLITNPKLYHKVMQALDSGHSALETARRFYLSQHCIQQIIILSRLSERLRLLFFNNIFSFQQVKLYAAQPRTRIQDQVFSQIGPLASPNHIRKALYSFVPDNLVPDSFVTDNFVLGHDDQTDTEQLDMLIMDQAA